MFELIICRNVQKDRAQPIEESVELHPLPRVEARVSPNPEASPHEIRHRQMEKNRQLQMSIREVHSPDLHADSETAWTAVFGGFHGTASQPGEGLPG